MRRRYWGTVAGIFGVTAFLNIIAWNSRAFCDWYVDNLFPVWGHTYGRLSDLSSLSVGEMMIAIGAVLLAIAIVLGLVAVIFILSRKKENCRWIKPYMRIFVAILAIVCLIMTLNCYMLYHCSTFEEKYLEEYTHKIGNLTITGYNSTLGNKSFEEKRDRKSKDGQRFIGYKNGLEINRDIAEKETWSIDDIKTRTSSLVAQLLEMFKFPG